MGCSATVDGGQVLAGKPGWFQEMGLDFGGPWSIRFQSLQDQGKTVVVIAVDKKIAGLIAVADPVKPESKEAIESPSQTEYPSRHAHWRQFADRTGDRIGGERR